jgi:hypothetical protein
MTTTSSHHRHQYKYLIIVAVLFAVGYWLSRIALDRGIIPHTDLASVEFPSAGWPTGQSATCSATRLNAQALTVDCTGSGPLGETHDTYVRFFGNVTEDAMKFRCERGSAVVTCRLPGK